MHGTLAFTVDAADCRRLLAPAGLAMPTETVTGLTVTGGEIVAISQAHGLEQAAAVIAPCSAEVTIRYGVAPPEPGQGWPEAAFRPRATRYTTAAEALAQDARGTADAVRRSGGTDADAAQALAEAARARFAYAHPEHRFTDGQDAVPYLACGATPGSCVDINTYFVASLRAAGIEAAYLYGVFFPAERDEARAGQVRRRALDGHCWVATRHHGPEGVRILEWDIAHHMKAGLGPVQPTRDPRPGCRLALCHSMGHRHVVDGAIHEAKIIGVPIGIGSGGVMDAPLREIVFDDARLPDMA
ncbi:transglutaminase domain-containing protein [Roseovarius aquimarinus]|uniref:Transglutaminase domain-containing protein n=1 Tax=Roseovarius aquimarinus TaxID=1229156 RepID=A0ABW7IAM3_9RHOB